MPRNIAIPPLSRGSHPADLVNTISRLTEVANEMQAGFAQLNLGQVPDGSGTPIASTPDLSGYFLLAGRTLGQVAYGGTGAADTLTLLGTSADTTSSVLLSPASGATAVMKVEDSSTFGTGGSGTVILDVVGHHDGGGGFAQKALVVRSGAREIFTVNVNDVGTSTVQVGTHVRMADSVSTAGANIFLLQSTAAGTGMITWAATSQTGNFAEWWTASGGALRAAVTIAGYFQGAGVALKGATSGTLTVLPAGVTTNHTLTLPANNASGALTNNGSGTLSWTPAAAAPTTFQDSTFNIYDDGDNTKILAFQVSSLGAGVTRTLTAPAANGTILTDASSILETAITNGALLARVADAETITNLWIFRPATDVVNLSVRQKAGGTQNVFEVTDSAGSPYAQVDSTGLLYAQNMGAASINTTNLAATGDINSATLSSGGGALTVTSVGVQSLIMDNGTGTTAVFDFSGIGAAQTYTLPSTGGALVTSNNPVALGSKTLNTSCVIKCNTGTGVTFQDNTATTKQMRFDLTQITTGQTRNVAFPDIAGTVVLDTSPVFYEDDALSYGDDLVYY